jgi:hypothetical protein
MQANNHHMLWNKNETEAEAGPVTHLTFSGTLRFQGILIARPLLMPVVQKLCRYECGLFMSRMYVPSQTLLCIIIVCCCS